MRIKIRIEGSTCHGMFLCPVCAYTWRICDWLALRDTETPIQVGTFSHSYSLVVLGSFPSSLSCPAGVRLNAECSELRDDKHEAQECETMQLMQYKTRNDDGGARWGLLLSLLLTGWSILLLCAVRYEYGTEE